MQQREQDELIPHLFRTEYRKIVSVLCRRFGLDQVGAAEDIAGDTFLTAAQTWGVKGIPPNPVAWLYHVAKNKAKTYLQRDSIYDKTRSPELHEPTSIFREQDIDLSANNINDSQLQMMFAICHPSIPPEAQIGLSLRILCGFGIDEIADAFLTSKEAINKRLFRAKEKLREEKIKIELPGASEIDQRLETVLRTIYLLFSEGYYSTTNNATIRKDLCFEAIRLCTMLVENENTDRPMVNALLALMYFHASRLDARIGPHGEPVLYDEQDTNCWDVELISNGGYFLNRAASGNNVSKYHLEAAIAYWHTQKPEPKSDMDESKKWENILQLYNRLLQVEYSPMAALNRTYALSKANGKAEGIIEAEKLKLTDSHFYYVLLGDLYTEIDNDKAKAHFETAYSLATTETDKRFISKRISALPEKFI
jgi:RNA polymerase sigma factor (sigma-70 family)